MVPLIWLPGTAPVTCDPWTLCICALVTQLTQLWLRPSAVAALTLLTAYGVEPSGWRGLSVMKVPPPLGRTAISRNRLAPLKQLGHAPKSSCTVNIPELTGTLLRFNVAPNCAPLPTVEVSKS